MKKRAQILLVEDEPNFGAVLKSYLSLANYKVEWVKDGKAAYSKFQNEVFDLCILDIMMPEMDGFSLGKEIKRLRPNLPFIYLTAKGLKEDILKGFKLGAEDYLTKPFDSDILLEKIKVVLQRKIELGKETSYDKEEYTVGLYSFKPSIRKLKINDKTVKLSPKESSLLFELLNYKNEVMPRTVALSKIWGEDNYFTARSMDVYIAKLRKYLREDPTIRIENIHGNGFQLIIE